MRKRFFQISFALLAILVAFTSCSKVPEYMNAIPADASMVLVFNTKQLALKAKMNQFNETKICKKLKAEFESESAEMGKLFENILKDPTMTGVKVSSDMCLYMNAGEHNNFCVGFLGGIKNKETFNAFVSDLLKATKSKIEIKNEGEISYIPMGSNILIWNNNSLLLLSFSGYSLNEEGRIELAKKQLLQTKENSIASTSDFKSFYKKQKDVDIWVSSKNLQKLSTFNQHFAGMFPSFYFSTSTHMHTQFMDGEIKVTSESYMSDSLKKVLKEKPLVKTFENKQILKILPDKSFVALSFCLNMTNIYELFIKQIPQLDQANEALKQNSLSVKEIFESIGGDFVFTLNNISTQEISYPSFASSVNPNTGKDMPGDSIKKRVPKIDGTLCLSLNNTKVFDKIMAMIPQDQIKKEGNFYTVPMPGMSLYWGVSNKILIFTTQKEIIEKAQSGGLKNNLMSTEIGNKIANNASYVYLNLNIKNYPDLQKLLFEDKSTNAHQRAAYNIWSIFDAVEGASNTDAYSSEGSIKLTSDKENSLYLILKTLDDNVESFF